MYNRSEIMKAAWKIRERFGLDMAACLRKAWYTAKCQAPIWKLYGDGRLLASGLTYDQAGQMQWQRKCSFWEMDIKLA